ncbi:MAG: polysaccharide deacetylase family protein [Candidatus Vogelbacteria bacterium]|nr:polysaccharide deacetylase family protein [Candidatus Vogelbacteria bacterium]
MPSVCFYFQVHQPERVKKYRVFDIGHDPHYFNDESDTSLNNRKVIRKVAEKCYLPTNNVMLELLLRHPEFKVSYSLSGVLLDQLERSAPDVLASFQTLAQTGRVEFLAETYYHTLAYLYSPAEFRRQVRQHRRKIIDLFGQDPAVFRHTELVYNNDLAREVAALDFRGVLAEGADHILGWRSPNFVYQPPGTKIKLLLKNYRLSDDVAFRFSSRDWSDWPLTAPKFASWISALNGDGQVVNLFMDYETFGEHQWADTGIFNFLRALPSEVLKHPDNDFVTVSEAMSRYEPVGELDAPHFYSWADTERDLSAWLSNPMQQAAAERLYALEEAVLRTKDQPLLESWRRLGSSDHLYYMCTKWWRDGDVHKYFSPYESPYEAFISYMNVMNDLELRVSNKLETEHV